MTFLFKCFEVKHLRIKRLQAASTLQAVTNCFHSSSGYKPLPHFKRLQTAFTLQAATSRFHTSSGYKPLPLFKRLQTAFTLQAATSRFHSSSGYKPLPLFKRLQAASTLQAVTSHFYSSQLSGYKPLPHFKRLHATSTLHNQAATSRFHSTTLPLNSQLSLCFLCLLCGKQKTLSTSRSPDLSVVIFFLIHISRSTRHIASVPALSCSSS